MNDYYLLALNRIPTIQPGTALKLLEHWPKLEELFKTSKADLLALGMKDTMATSISQFNFKFVDEDIDYCRKNHHEIITIFDDNYPALLREITHPPLVLFTEGDINLLHSPNIAMVGSRKPTNMGKQHAFNFAKELASQSLCICSGLAIGIDTFCHLGALEANGNTIAVMATGIDEIYPRRNKDLADNIKKNGLLITEFPLKTPPMARQFPRRNRIISGLSLGTLVIEAAIKSGSLITARKALEQNREVFAMPGSINNPLTKGCHYLLQQGAKLVTNCQDILNELAIEANCYQPNQGDLLDKMHKNEIELAKNLQNLVEFVNYEVTNINGITEKSGLSVSELLSQLVELELLGLIKSVPGGYIRC